MSQPDYWKNLNWANGWDHQQPAVVALSAPKKDSVSRKITNGSKLVLARSSSETDLVSAVAQRGSYDTAFLDDSSDLFRRIEEYLRTNAAARTLAPPTGERTRMVRAQQKIDDFIAAQAAEKDKGAKSKDERKDGGDGPAANEVLVLKTNLNTLREDPDYMKPEYTALYTKYGVPRTKQKPPKSGQVVITKIRVIRHKALWKQYEAARTRIADDINQTTALYDTVNREMAESGVGGYVTPPRALTTGGKVFGRNSIAFTTKSAEGISASSKERLPVLDSGNGEVLLMHGTLPDVIKIIVDKGFNPDFNKGTTKNNVTKYGALGQGSYFGDSFAKVQTYIGCPICNALKCDCTDRDGAPVDRMLILARCLLGIPTTARTHDSHRKDSTSSIKAGKHSVVGQERGALKNWSLFGSNEFLLKEADQMYPEFVVYWHRV